MVSSVAFKTRARTIDHLGREQIADCPTAVSELWKNAFDAYARKVELHIFDGDIPVTALVDDGHGMSRSEFEDKWLTVGTESKATGLDVADEDRNGLHHRPKQGQKGIGRLSSAAIGSLLLLVSKRKNSNFTAALIDWRIFENPFLMLHDIKIPLVEFEHKSQLQELLPSLFDSLMGNLWGDNDNDDRNARLISAWKNFEKLEVAQGLESTKSKIENVIVNACFIERHFESWDLWNGRSSKGTALFMAAIHDDLTAQLRSDSILDHDSADQRATERLIQTLSNFTDPFVDEEGAKELEFSTAVIAWNGRLKRPIVDEIREFDLADLDNLEHVVEGRVDSSGCFSGRVKIFGEWQDDISIKLKKEIQMRKDTEFGPFTVHFGTYEKVFNSSTLAREQFDQYEAMGARYGGLRIYRNGLRVMPYGREDSDFFQIEKRRSEHAGRAFWANRRTFGRIAISRSLNPNLKDKAGREGIIDNKASKHFRDVVENILKETARRFFGTVTDRHEKIKDIRAGKEAEKALADRKKWLQSRRNKIKKLLRKNFEPLHRFLDTLECLAGEIASGHHLNEEEGARNLKKTISDHSAQLKEFSLSPVPPNLGSVEDEYRDYRRLENRAISLLNEVQGSVNAALERLCPKSAPQIVQSELQRNAAHLHARIRKWSTEGKSLLNEEIQRFNDLVEECNKSYHAEVFPILEDVDKGRTALVSALKSLDDAYLIHDLKNAQRLQPYITALQSLRDQIDLEGLTSHSLKESIALKKEAERLNALAQLGITVEIIGHEIEGLDMTISRGLKALPNSIKGASAYKDIVFAHQGLSDRWRFLSPLKLSGERAKDDISGQMIFEYIQKFFDDKFTSAGIDLQATEAFRKFEIYEQPARIYPVFINLVNNSRYWVKAGGADNQIIRMDVKDECVIVSDNGPGVEEEDLSQLFTLFFTRKERGGRGVGLYLCKTNLQAGGHSIRYEIIEDRKLLPGANFAIEFQGGKYV